MAVLQQGSSGPDVTALQTRLKQLGFDPNGIDGNFGPGTKAAVIAFQQSNGLTADGMAGPLTMTALQLGDSAANASLPSPAVSAANAGLPSPAVGAANAGLPSPAVGAANAAVPSSAVSNTGGLKLNALTGHLPASVIAQIPETALKFGITTNLRLAHFLAQCALESVEFTATVENLNYSAPRLLQIFGKYFQGVDPAQYANNPVKIGNRVYANRMGNGNEASGDGYKFRGRGYIQLTGRTNYTSFTKFIGDDCVATPDLVATTYPLASAAFFFNSNNIWPICDRGADDATVTAVSTRVNGSPPNAVPERIQYFKEFMQALS
jgi:putative chitinase